MIDRILLVDVDVSRDSSASVYYSHHPVGLLYLAAAIKQKFPGIKFKVFHTSTSNDPISSIETIISSFKPDLVGLRSLSIAKSQFMQVAEKIRNLLPGIPVIGGGPYPSSSYAEILLERWVDLVVIGEGESTFSEIVEKYSTSEGLPMRVMGTAVLEDGKVLINEPRPVIQDIDQIPFPDYSFIDLKDYTGIENHALQDSSKSAFILSSRGCPYGCLYCHQLFGKKIRRRSAENVVAEMKKHVELRGINDFVFLDDVFNVPMNEAKKVLSLIIKDLPGVRINFPNGLRADMIDDEMLDMFEQAGTVEMALAVETAVPRLQKIIGKNLDIHKAEKAIHAATKRFITRIFFITGIPTETYDEALYTIDFAASFKYAAQPMLSVMRIYNNTRLYSMLDPTPAQVKALALQEKKVLHLEMFDNIEFYGDLFPPEKVPLKSSDLKELLYYWMRNVLIDSDRIRKSHEVLLKHLDHEKIIEFYRNVFDKPKFNDADLIKLLKTR